MGWLPATVCSPSDTCASPDCGNGGMLPARVRSLSSSSGSGTFGILATMLCISPVAPIVRGLPVPPATADAPAAFAGTFTPLLDCACVAPVADLRGLAAGGNDAGSGAYTGIGCSIAVSSAVDVVTGDSGSPSLRKEPIS